MLDLAYLVRSILQDLELNDTGVCGVFLHGTPHGDARRTMCAGNNLAFIRELHHYARTKQYIGDEAAEIPDQDFTVPFDESYVVPIGDDLRTAGFSRGVRGVADYLLKSVDGDSSLAFDHIREKSKGRQRKPLAVRSFAVKTEEEALLSPGELVASMKDRLLQTRGGFRMLHAGDAPANSEMYGLQEALGHPPMHVPDKTGGDFLCCEVEGVPFCDIEATLEETEPESVDIADRMHTRIDVEWS